LQNSWQKLLSSSQSIVELAHQQQWRKITQVVIQRRRIIDKHFEKFPVGTETADFYSSKLSAFFEIENHIEALARQARSIAFRN
jgi:hypothetical protein